uniref:Uncharacterized protein n=1 Tax=Zea mays TaxID=4577 RepID=B6UCF1_MAIZE|nr:hypothetical protein [Zea mays]
MVVARCHYSHGCHISVCHNCHLCWNTSLANINYLAKFRHNFSWWFNKLFCLTLWQIGATKAEFFCKTFEEVHEKLVHRELNLDAAKKFLSAYES